MTKPTRRKHKAANQKVAKAVKAVVRQPLHEPAGINTVGLRDYLLLFGLLLAGSIVIFHEFLFFQNTYLFKDIGSDSINIFYPHIALLLDYVSRVGVPLWSFSQGMGQNVFVGLGDPLLLVFFAFGRDNIGFAMAYAEVLKILIGASFFFLYLRKLGLTPFACTIGGLLYGFTGYMILGGQWYLCSWEAMVCALLLLAFEKLYQDGVWALFPIPIALFAVYQPFDLYLYGLFILGYATVRFLERERWSAANFARLLAKMALSTALGLALGGVLLFENVQALLLSPRVTGEAGYFKQFLSQPIFSLPGADEYVSDILRLFSSDLQGTGSDYKGWKNYFESPMLYCGLLTLVYAPQFFAFVNWRKKKIYLVLAAVALLALVFPYLRYVFWAFTGNYYRSFAFLVALILLFCGMRGLSFVDQSGKLNPRLLVMTLVFLLWLLVGTSYGADGVNVRLALSIAGMLLLYGMSTAILLVGKNRQLWRLATIAMVCIEVAYLSRIAVNDRPVITAAELAARAGYGDSTVEAIRYLASIDGDFYRVHKDYSSGLAMHGSLNDAKAQHYYGSASYSSFNQQNYIRFLEGMDVVKASDELATRWARGLNRTILWILGSVKYALSKSPDNDLQSRGYRSLAAVGDVRIYQNDFFLPLGFAYDTFVPASDFSKLTTEQKDRVILKALVIDDAEQDRFRGLLRLTLDNVPTAYPISATLSDLSARKSAALSMTGHSENKISGTIKLDKREVLFFSIPFDVGWSALVDGEPAHLEKVDFGLTGILLDKGEHVVELTFRPRFLTLGLIVSSTALLLYAGLLMWPRFRRKASRAEPATT